MKSIENYTTSDVNYKSLYNVTISCFGGKALKRYFFDKLYMLILYCILIIVTPIIEVRNTYVYYDMFNAVGEENYNKLLRLMLLGITFFVLHGLLRYWITVVRECFVNNLRIKVKNDCIKKILQSDYSSFGEQDVGVYISEFTNDISLLEYKYFQAWYKIIENTATIIIVGYAIIHLKHVVALVIIIGEISSVLISALSKKYSESVNNIFFEKLGKFTNSLKDFFSCFFLYKNYGVERNILNKFHEKNKEVENSKIDADVTVNFLFTLSRLCTSFLKFTVVGLGVIYIVAFDGIFGEIYISYQFTGQIFSPTQNIISGLNDIYSVRGIVKRIKKLLNDDNTTSVERSKQTIIPDDKRSIRYNNVILNKEDKCILKGITLRFEPGKKYLIIGKNGSGKSSLLRLLKGYDKYEGQITLGGIDITQIDSSVLSKSIVYINEQVSLFCDTVRNNITLYRQFTDEEIESAVNMSGLSVPLDRIVSDGEINLSSGERRRIELARAYLSKAQILIFDEAVSTLDVETSYNIEKAMLEMNDRTIIFVSHNFSSSLIREYDSIILISDAQIIAQGTHDELLGSSQMYKRIIQIKSGKTIDAS